MHMSLRIREPASGLDVRASLLGEKAPAIVGLIAGWLGSARTTPAVHAMWTGPEISAQIAIEELEPLTRSAVPPVQNSTIYPQPGELVFLHIRERAWEGNPDPIFDLGVFYGERARLFFPVGWMPGSVFARVVPEDLDKLVAACGRIRGAGRTKLEWSLERQP